MPWYVVNGMPVHMLGTKLPPPCNVCRGISGFQCDGHIGGGKTCDRHLCEAHATETGPDRHLCPECLEQRR